MTVNYMKARICKLFSNYTIEMAAAGRRLIPDIYNIRGLLQKS